MTLAPLLLRLLLLCTSFLAVGCKARDLPQAAAHQAQTANSAPLTAIMNEKESRTVAQRKLDSHIVLALKKNRSEPPFDKPTLLDPDLAIDSDGRVLVDITATVTADLLSRIEMEGGQVINSFANARAIRALFPLSRLETLAGLPDVQFISPAAQTTTNAGNNQSGATQGSNIKPQN